MRVWKGALWAILIWAATASAAISQQFTRDELNWLVERAHDLCDAVKEARGKKSGTQLEAGAEAKVGGLFGKLVDVGGGTTATISREQFEGLSQEATAAALEGDRKCRERMVTKLGACCAPNNPFPS
jgi:hypothetical protein